MMGKKKGGKACGNSGFAVFPGSSAGGEHYEGSRAASPHPAYFKPADRQMEEELGVKLFDRGARKIALTNEGLLLRRRAEEILELVDKDREGTDGAGRAD